MCRSKSTYKCCLIFATLLALSFPEPSFAKFFKYIDKNGRVVFVDDLSKVPEEYRDAITTYKEDLDHLSPKEREAVRKTREEKAATEKRLKSLETKIVIKGNSVLVPAEVGYGWKRVKTMMLLDTGAESTVFHLDAIQDLKIHKAEFAYGQGAGGHIIPTAKVTFKYIKIGPFEEKNMPAYVIENLDPSAQYGGLLGMDFLMKHKYRIDYKKNLIIWQSPPPNAFH